MRFSTIIAWLIGIGLLVGLVAFNDAPGVLRAVVSLRGWLLVVIAFHAAPLLLDVLSWHRLFLEPPSLLALLRIRWIGEGVNGLFPVPHLGELLRAEMARRIARHGEAGASVVVDVTLGIVTQVLFAALGLALFSMLAIDSLLSRALLFATAILLVGAFSFYLLQRAGMFALIASVVGRWSDRLQGLLDTDEARALDERVRALYGRRRDVLVAGIWRLVGWVAGAGEIWLILEGLGHPVDFAAAVMLESLSQVARAAAFAIPGGLGVQDGVLLLLCAQLGLDAETALALSLAKRCRELALGLPALFAGYVIFARRLTAADGSRGGPPSA